MYRRSSGRTVARSHSTGSNKSTVDYPASQEALIAARRMFLKAQERSSMESTSSEGPSRKSSISQPPKTVRKVQSIRFVASQVPTRISSDVKSHQTEAWSNNFKAIKASDVASSHLTVPSAYKVPRRTTSLSQVSSNETVVRSTPASIATSIVVSDDPFLQDENLLSEPSSFQRLRKSKSMFSPIKHVPSMAFSFDSTEYSVNNAHCQVREATRVSFLPDTYRARLQTSKSLSTLRPGTVAYVHSPTSARRADNDLAVQIARDRFLRDIERQRLRQQPSFIRRAREHHAFRKTLRGNSLVGDTKSILSQRAHSSAVSQKLRKVSKSLTKRFLSVFSRRSESNGADVPATFQTSNDPQGAPTESQIEEDFNLLSELPASSSPNYLITAASLQELSETPALSPVPSRAPSLCTDASNGVTLPGLGDLPTWKEHTSSTPAASLGPIDAMALPSIDIRNTMVDAPLPRDRLPVDNLEIPTGSIQGLDGLGSLLLQQKQAKSEENISVGVSKLPSLPFNPPNALNALPSQRNRTEFAVKSGNDLLKMLNQERTKRSRTLEHFTPYQLERTASLDQAGAVLGFTPPAPLYEVDETQYEGDILSRLSTMAKNEPSERSTALRDLEEKYAPEDDNTKGTLCVPLTPRHKAFLEVREKFIQHLQVPSPQYEKSLAQVIKERRTMKDHKSTYGNDPAQTADTSPGMQLNVYSDSEYSRSESGRTPTSSYRGRHASRYCSSNYSKHSGIGNIAGELYGSIRGPYTVDIDNSSAPAMTNGTSATTQPTNLTTLYFGQDQNGKETVWKPRKVSGASLVLVTDPQELSAAFGHQGHRREDAQISTSGGSTDWNEKTSIEEVQEKNSDEVCAPFTAEIGLENVNIVEDRDQETVSVLPLPPPPPPPYSPTNSPVRKMRDDTLPNSTLASEIESAVSSRIAATHSTSPQISSQSPLRLLYTREVPRCDQNVTDVECNSTTSSPVPCSTSSFGGSESTVLAGRSTSAKVHDMGSPLRLLHAQQSIANLSTTSDTPPNLPMFETEDTVLRNLTTSAASSPTGLRFPNKRITPIRLSDLVFGNDIDDASNIRKITKRHSTSSFTRDDWQKDRSGMFKIDAEAYDGDAEKENRTPIVTRRKDPMDNALYTRRKRIAGSEDSSMTSERFI